MIRNQTHHYTELSSQIGQFSTDIAAL
jgi:hypothetical protein